MKKRFIINTLAAGALCLVIFGIIEKSKVEKMKAQNRELQTQKQQLELENKTLRENLENLKIKETAVKNN